MVTLSFTAPYKVDLLQEPTPAPGPGEALIQTVVSAISPGTELLIYRGQFPTALPVDENISSLAGSFRYPLKYGYAAVGRVIALGASVDASWRDRLVFAFQPHGSHFVAGVNSLIPLPVSISPESACFLPNMETAINLVMDGRPLIGERVAVFGQGIVGLLSTALLAQFPLAQLTTFDRYPARREHSLSLGASESLLPDEAAVRGDFDLTYELSGNPSALQAAVAVTGFDGRVLIGSWYGQKTVDLDLGGQFHRSRIRLVSSQVSTLASDLTGRWTKARRFEVAWAQIQRLRPEQFITHRFPIQGAAGAYALLDQHPEKALQVVFTY